MRCRVGVLAGRACTGQGDHIFTFSGPPNGPLLAVRGLDTEEACLPYPPDGTGLEARPVLLVGGGSVEAAGWLLEVGTSEAERQQAQRSTRE